MLRAIAALLLALTVWAAPALAQPAFPERGTAPVLDLANIIDDATEAQLTQRLEQFEATNQRQFVIFTTPSLDGYEISDYGYQLGRAWGLGDAQNNDGIILIVAPNERRMRIEVGYGLEGTMPDGLAFEIVEDMKPLFRDGRYSEGIAQGAAAIITQLELPPEEAARAAAEAAAAREGEQGIPFGALIWIGIIFFFFILPMLRGGGRRYRSGGVAGAVGDIILWEAGKAIGRGVFGGGSDGGGFGGGGGSFGGGGASGGW